MNGKHFSLKYKLLILLVIIPIGSLAIYMMLATQVFTQDKIAYVFDSSAAVARAMTAQVRSELKSSTSQIKPVIEGYKSAEKEFDATAKLIFEKEELLEHLLVLVPNAAGGYKVEAELVKQNAAHKIDEPLWKWLAEMAKKEKSGLKPHSQDEGYVAMSLLYGDVTKPDHSIVVWLTKAKDFFQVFYGSGVHFNYLLTGDGQILFGNQSGPIKDFKTWSYFTSLSKKTLPEGTGTADSSDGKPMLVSYSKVGQGNLIVLSLLDRAEAMRARDLLLMKSILFFVAIIALSTIISVFASGKLTRALRELFEASRKVATGNFNVNVKVNSTDEVGSLADSFNVMASEVARLLTQVSEKIKIEKELEVARAVQETLFPALHFKSPSLQISGFSQPATQCGGDWWHYCRIGTKIYTWIGDATGHGVPAALITSAAKGVATMIECLDEMSPAIAMSMMNRAIHETSKGQMNMTFFIAAFDEYENTLTYCNASHNPPYLLKNTGKEIKRKDLKSLNKNNGPRLGERKDVQYEETTITLDPGDAVFFYTDGLSDMGNKEGTLWGARNMTNALLSAVAQTQDVQVSVGSLREKAEEFRQGTPLADDVTFFLVRHT